MCLLGTGLPFLPIQEPIDSSPFKITSISPAQDGCWVQPLTRYRQGVDTMTSEILTIVQVVHLLLLSVLIIISSRQMSIYSDAVDCMYVSGNPNLF